MKDMSNCPSQSRDMPSCPFCYDAPDFVY